MARNGHGAVDESGRGFKSCCYRGYYGGGGGRVVVPTSSGGSVHYVGVVAYQKHTLHWLVIVLRRLICECGDDDDDDDDDDGECEVEGDDDDDYYKHTNSIE